MNLTRRSFAAKGLAACLAARTSYAADDVISAAVLAITHAHPRSMDGLQMSGESGAVSIAEYRGQLVILNAWATWCLPCRREMPSLSRLATILEGKRAYVLPVAFDRGGLASVRTFHDETGIRNLPLLVGDVNSLQSVTGNVGLPSTYLIASDGMMRWSVTGEAQWDDADTVRWITSLLPA